MIMSGLSQGKGLSNTSKQTPLMVPAWCSNLQRRFNKDEPQSSLRRHSRPLARPCYRAAAGAGCAAACSAGCASACCASSDCCASASSASSRLSCSLASSRLHQHGRLGHLVVAHTCPSLAVACRALQGMRAILPYNRQPVLAPLMFQIGM